MPHDASEQRVSIARSLPEGFKALMAFDHLAGASLPEELRELVRLRVSIVNGCHFCVDMHTTKLVELGTHGRVIASVAAWHESPFLDDDTKAALDLADHVTEIGPESVDDARWGRAVDAYGEVGAADLLLLITAINTWNRLAIATRLPVPPL